MIHPILLRHFQPPIRIEKTNEGGGPAPGAPHKKRRANHGAPCDAGLDKAGLTYRFKRTINGKAEEWFKMITRPLTQGEIHQIRQCDFGGKKSFMALLRDAMVVGDEGRVMTLQDIATPMRESGRHKRDNIHTLCGVVDRTVSRMNLVLSQKELPFYVSYEGYVCGKPNLIPRTERRYRFFAIELVKPAKT